MGNQRVRHFIIGLILNLIVTVYAVQNKEAQTSTNTSEAVILEIIEDDQGMVTVPGEFIYFRLYESGRAEYEELHQYQYPPFPKWKYVKREIKINPKDINEIIQLAEQPDFLKANETYPRLKNYTDMLVKLVVRYKGNNNNKQVVLFNYRPELPEAKSFYPASLRNLIQKVNELKDK